MHHLRTSLLTLLAVAAFPAAAQAAPHWSSPKQVVAPPADPATQTVGTPQAVAGPKGEPIGFAGDGESLPLFLSGSITSGLTAKRITDSSRGGARGAVGADGTVAAVWASSGKGHLALGTVAGTFAAPVDLPGDGVNALDVAVSPNGTATVAWRTKAADGTYQMLIAQAPKGGGLGEPQVVDSGKAGISLVDAAAGANGTVAVAYTKIAPPYRTRVTVKPAGAAAFEAPQPISSSTRADTSPAVSVATDGTVVAGWANPEAGMVAFRRPGATAFEAPVSLGTPAFALDLQPTPQGGTALAFTAPSEIRAAVALPGAGFAPAAVGSAPGQVPPVPSITVDAAGAATVLYTESQSGEVRAVALGGATTVIGYGTPGSLTPVSTAATGPAQSFALWRDAEGGISSATFGETAPPATGPGEKPAPVDRTAPKVRLVSSKRVSVTRRTTALKLRLSCNEPCAIGVEGNLRTTIG